MAKKVDLVFRTIGERTSRLALRLAIESIQPEHVHVIEDIQPFWRTVEKMLSIPFRSETVVFMDADCLILENLLAFLEEDTRPHVDACVLDKFRGRVTAGVHITRLDLVERMRRVSIDFDDPGYYLKPESWIRHRALQQMKEVESLKRFQILHDFEQDFENIFFKLMLRDLRSRKRHKRLALNRSIGEWPDDDPDFLVAKQAIDYSRHNLWPSSGQVAHDVLCMLPDIARQHVSKLGLRKKDEFTEAGLDALCQSPLIQSKLRRPPLAKKIIGIGLNPIDLQYLKWALEVLGLIIFPSYTATMNQNGLSLGISPLSLQEDFDGLVGVPLSPFYRQLDAAYPDGQFILVKGSPQQWLMDLENVRSTGRKRLYQTTLQICPEQQIDASIPDWENIYRNFCTEVDEYFRDQSGNYLLFDLTAGHGWEELCKFLQIPPVRDSFFG